MSIATREEQILRIKAASFQSELNEALDRRVREHVVATVKTILEAALREELQAALDTWCGPKPRRSGYFARTTDTQYGRIADLQVPKLRWGNKKRPWRILKRYQRALTGLLDWRAYVYVMGLSLRDLQEALYFLLGAVLSPTAINRVTLRVQEQLEAQRQAPITTTPPILIVDGVWVDIQYTLEKFKIDQAGHRRQCRQAQERVILVALAVWPDGTYHILHFEVAEDEDEAHWLAFFDHLIARGLDPVAVELIVSDGTHGLPAVMKKRLPHARWQRCVTHKVRGMKRYLTYQQLPEPSETDAPLSLAARKQQWWAELKAEAYAIYDAVTYDEAQQLLQDFVAKWQPWEPQAVHAFLWGIERTFTFYQFDASLHPRIRTTNLLERLFREFRAKTDEVGAFPNETSCLTLFFLVVQREHAKHNRPFIMAKNTRH
jgi:transposase-like protein